MLRVPEHGGAPYSGFTCYLYDNMRPQGYWIVTDYKQVDGKLVPWEWTSTSGFRFADGVMKELNFEKPSIDRISLEKTPGFLMSEEELQAFIKWATFREN